MSDFKNAVDALVSNMFKTQFPTGLIKDSHSHNITLSDWNNLVDYCEHLISDVELLTDFVKKIKNEDLLVNTVDTSNIVYGTDNDGNQTTLPQSDLISKVEELSNDGTPYLKLTFADGSVKNVTLTNIFETFVKTRTEKSKLYGTGNDGEDVVYTLDPKNEAVKGRVVRRTYDNGGIHVPSTPESHNEAASKAYVDKFVPIKPKTYNYYPNDVPAVYANYPDNSVRLVQMDFSFDPWADFPSYELDPERLEDYYGGAIVQRNDIGGIYVPKESYYEYDAASKWYVDELGKRVDTLESLSLKFRHYSLIASSVPVPAYVQKYALVNKVGGKTYQNPNLLKKANFVKNGTYNGLQVLFNTDGSIILNGTATKDTVLYRDPSSFIGKDMNISFGTEVSGLAIKFTEYDMSDLENSWEVHVGLDGYSEWTFGNGEDWSLIAKSGRTFTNLRIFPMFVNGRNSKPYRSYLDGLYVTTVDELNSVTSDGVIVDTVSIPVSAIQQRLTALSPYFRLGDGIDIDINNHIDFNAERVIGNVAYLVLDGDSVFWTAQVNKKTGYRRFLFTYKGTSIPAPKIAYRPDGSLDTSYVTSMITNSYPSVSATASHKGTTGICFSTDVCFVRDPAFDDYVDNASAVLAWKEHLNEHPVTIVYQVAEPITTTISALLGDEPGRIEVRDGGKVTLKSEFDDAAYIDMSFVEWKGV